MDCRDELTECPLLSMKNLKDDELEHEYEQPLLCLKLYLDKFESNILIFLIVASTPYFALHTFYWLYESTSIIMPKKVIFGIFYLALVTFVMFKQLSLLRAQRNRIFKYLIEEGDIKNRVIHPPSKKIEIDYSPPSKQSRYCGLSYIFIHGWQAFASCLITWAYYLVFLFLIISLCNVDEEIVKDMCPHGEHKIFYLYVFVGFFWGIFQLSFTSIRLTSHCDEAELKLLRNVNSETHELVLCKKRSEIKKDERVDSLDMLVFVKKRSNVCQCNASESKEEELGVLRSKYNDLQACFDDLKMKYDSLRHNLTCDNDIEAAPILQ